MEKDITLSTDFSRLMERLTVAIDETQSALYCLRPDRAQYATSAEHEGHYNLWKAALAHAFRVEEFSHIYSGKPLLDD
jgi:hypothetical protein